MSKATRMMAMVGLALAAGATIAAAPAAASVSPAAGTTVAAQSVQQGATKAPSRSWVEGYYHSYFRCVRVGRFGERIGRWHSFDCDRVRPGLYRLEVERSWRGGHWNNDWDRGHGHWNRGHRDWDRGHRGHRGHR